jgi:hypothetical protein
MQISTVNVVQHELCSFLAIPKRNENIINKSYHQTSQKYPALASLYPSTYYPGRKSDIEEDTA